MARKPRYCPGGYVHRVLKRSVRLIALFRQDEDYASFERVMLDASPYAGLKASDVGRSGRPLAGPQPMNYIGKRCLDEAGIKPVERKRKPKLILWRGAVDGQGWKPIAAGVLNG